MKGALAWVCLTPAIQNKKAVKKDRLEKRSQNSPHHKLGQLKNSISAEKQIPISEIDGAQCERFKNRDQLLAWVY
ncbi:hypothetical protein WH95_02315 [Kiloniella litopenaei]|uniref:Uncharacterized protein n=1 Tax=Kiloniella litopenaei TaxID=1549748 RepID=A0A0M2RCP4_9PROT|nr:hypothetical protein WH95_02315 [Kiloniella litopenaei]